MDDERRRLLVLIGVTAGAILIPLNTSMLSVGLSPIIQDFGVTNATGTWLILLYLAIITSLQPTAGKLGDLYGHRRVFLTGLVLFAAASVGAAMASTFPLLVLFRVLQGFAGAALAPNATALIRLTFPPHRQGHAMGIYVGLFSIGLTVGPVIGGLLIGWFGWPALYWFNVPVIALSGWLGLQVLPSGTGRAGIAVDWWGTALFSLLVTSIVLAAGLWREGRLPVPVWLTLAGLAVLTVLFVRAEERAPDPLIRFSLFRLRGFGAASAAVFCLHTVMHTVLVAVPLYLQQGRDFSAAAAGVVLAVYSVVQVVVSPVAGSLSDRLGRRALVALGGGLYVVAAVILGALSAETPVFWTVLALVLGGVGTGLVSSPVQAAAMAACPRPLVGVGAGVYYSARYMGNIFGALLTALLLPVSFVAGAPLLYLAFGIIALMLVASAYFLPGADSRVDDAEDAV